MIGLALSDAIAGGDTEPVSQADQELAMDDRLFHAVEAVVPRAIDELDDVRLIVDTEVPSRGLLPMGSCGTVVAVHGDGEAFSVEFEEPFHALLLLDADQIEAIPGATRDRLIAEPEDIRHRRPGGH